MTLSCTSLAEDFSEVLAIVMDVARRPAFPEPELAKRRAEAFTAVRQDEDNPAVRAVESLFTLLYGAEHPYSRPARHQREHRADDRTRWSACIPYVPGRPPRSHRRDVRRSRPSIRATYRGWPGLAGRLDRRPPPAPSTADAGDSHSGKSQKDIAYGSRDQPPRPLALRVLEMNNILWQFAWGPLAATSDGQAWLTRVHSVDPTLARAARLRAGVDRKRRPCYPGIDRSSPTGRRRTASVEVAETRDFSSVDPRLLERTTHCRFLQTCDQFGLGLDYDHRSRRPRA